MRKMILVAACLLALGCGEDETSGEGAGGTSDETGGGAAIDTSLPGDPAAGQAIYEANCQACHGADGRGNGGVGGDFVGEPERLQQDNEVLLTTIADGISGARTMPPQRDLLTEEERRNALSYIRQTFGSSE